MNRKPARRGLSAELRSACYIALCLALAGCHSGQKASPAASVSAVPPATFAPVTTADVPAHVLTYQFFGVNGVPKGFPRVKTQVAARWVTWAMAGPREATDLSAAGMKLIYYTDPNRVAPKNKEYSTDENQFAHDCSGHRVAVRKGEERYLTDPASPTTLAQWKAEIADAQQHATFDAVFDDTAATTNSLSALPCGFDENRWIDQHIALVSGAGVPVLVGGIGDDNLPRVGKGRDARYSLAPQVRIVASASNAIGGAFEDCYASPSHPSNPGGVVTAGSFWRATEDTELALARMRKLFVCNERADRLSMDAAIDARIYSEASFLLTYDPATTMVRQQFLTPSQLDLGPEVKLVALDPVRPAPRDIEELRAAGGAYGREYRSCYVQSTLVGRCAVAVNPDHGAAVPFPFNGYEHTLELHGSGIEDGGLMDMSGPAPSSIAPVTGVVAFR